MKKFKMKIIYFLFVILFSFTMFSQNAIAQSNEDPEIMFNLAKEHFVKGEYNEAVTIYDNIGEVHAIHGHGGKTEVTMEPDFKKAFGELKSFVDNFSLCDVILSKVPQEGAASKLLSKN